MKTVVKVALGVVLLLILSPLAIALAAPNNGKLTDEQWNSIRKMCETEGCAILDAHGVARLSAALEENAACQRKRI